MSQTNDNTTVCTPPSQILCPVKMLQSFLWEAGSLEPCNAGTTNVFIEDPFSGTLLHSCSPENKRALPTSCRDVRFRSMASDSENGVFLSTGLGIVRARLEDADSSSNLESVVAGFVTVHLKGFNLGNSREDLVGLSLRGVPCRTILYFNSTDVACRVCDISVLSSPITGACITLTTVAGGTAEGTVLKEIAQGRVHAGHQKPMVYDVAVSDPGFQPTALAYHADSKRLFWWNRATSFVESCAADGSGLRRVAYLPRCGGLVVDQGSSGGGALRLWATEPRLGAVVEIDASGSGESLASQAAADVNDAAGGTPGPVRVVVAGLRSPSGLAIDELHGLLFVAETGGRILRGDSADLLAPRSLGEDAAPVGADTLRVVVVADARAELSELALLPSALDPRFDLTPRLCWTEANAHAVKCATVHGTLARTLTLASGEAPLLWPRSLVALPGRRSLVVGEYLGRVWELSGLPGFENKALAEPGALAARSFGALHEGHAAAALVVDERGGAGGEVRAWLERATRIGASQSDRSHTRVALRLPV